MSGDVKALAFLGAWFFGVLFIPIIWSLLKSTFRGKIEESEKSVKTSYSKITSNRLPHRRYVKPNRIRFKRVYRDLFRKREFRKRYQQYLKSEEWKKIREKVLIRSSGLCEACGEKLATEVHHRTYDRVGNESLIDLVATCDECHHKIHFGSNNLSFSNYEYRMTSEVWKPYRDTIFNRANHICEGCGENPVQDIFNLNTESSTAGPLFELAALCFRCQKRLSEKDCSDYEKIYYKAYLQSDEWKLKSQKIKDRVDSICEVCAEKPISSVRHLTFSRVGSEMLFDLVGVCDSCVNQLPELKSPEFAYISKSI